MPTIVGTATEEIMNMALDPQRFCASTSAPDSPQGIFPWLPEIPANPRRQLIAIPLLDPDAQEIRLSSTQLALFGWESSS
jgi:hypothetical protein